MLLGELKVGKTIEILIKRDGYNFRIISKVEDATDERVCVTLISNGTQVFEFLDTDDIDIVYRNEDRMWKWTNVKGSFLDLKGEMFHCLCSKEHGELYNRRNAFRISMNEKITIQYKINKTSAKEERAENYSNLAKRFGLDIDTALDSWYNTKTCQALVRDISEVGVGLYSNELLSLDDEVSFELQSKFGVIKCEGLVARFYESQNSNYKYYYGCRFTETNRTLIKYIYDVQRMELQRTRLGSTK